jgi:hypothetical protein
MQLPDKWQNITSVTWGETIFLIVVLGQLDNHMDFFIKYHDPCLLPNMKISSRWPTDLNVSIQTAKLFEKKCVSIFVTLE